MFIAKHNDEEEAWEQEQRRRAAVTAQPSEHRIRGPEDVSVATVGGQPACGYGTDISHLATPCGADNVLSTAIALGSASILRMFSPDLRVLESPIPLRPRSTPTRRMLQSSTAAFKAGACRKEAHQESTGSSSTTLFRREELIPDSVRKTTLANLDTKTLKAFRNIFAHDFRLGALHPGRALHADASANS